MSRPVAVICTLLAGGLVALQPPANASLSRYVGDFGAAFVSIMISAVIIGALLVTIGHPGRLAGIGSIRFEHVLGGIAGAVIVTVSLVAVRPLGAGALVALLVTAQLIVAVAVDRFGWLGVHHVGLTGTRWLGIALAIAGTILVTRT
ncbi:MAG TPA: DMT family transporter [Solirubrobacteraceae bacterium]|jgi:transporter family-2 protein